VATARKKTGTRKTTSGRAAAKPSARRAVKKKPAARTAAKKAATRKVATKKAKGATRKVATAKASPKVSSRRPAAKKTKVAAKTPANATRKKTAAHASLPRRAIFIDVENTSSEDALLDVIRSLAIDHRKRRVELAAVGNWRVVGQHVGRHLAALGAQLVHSAPAKGVRDWSDLWIAVAAGVWIGQAQPGDQLDIISNDRAFDAVGDAAAARGIEYRRIQHRRGVVEAPAAAEAEHEERPRRPRRRRRRSGTMRETPSTSEVGTTETARVAAPAAPTDLEPHGATRDQMVALIGRLTNNDSERWVNLDILERELKREGFSRPAGSPRLVTRLRVLKDVEVDSHGRVRLAPGAPVPEFVPPEAETLQSAPAAPAETKPATKRRRRRRKPANGEAREAAAEPTPAEAPDTAEADEAPAEAAAPKRRRRRRKPANGEAANAAEAAEAPAAAEPAVGETAAPKRRRRRSKAAATEA